MTPHAKLAKKIAEIIVLNRTSDQPMGALLTPELNFQRACYIYLFESPGRHLRTMHGAVLPQQKSLAEEIAENTIQAVTKKHIKPIRRADLSALRYLVAVLDPLQRISDPHHMNPRQHGVYIRSDKDKSAIVMPNRTGIYTAQDQIATAIREAKINTRAETSTMYRFNVSYFE